MKKLISMVAVLAFASAVFAIDISAGARLNVNTNLGSKSCDAGSEQAKEIAGGVGFAIYANLGLVDIGPVNLGIQPEFSMNFGNGVTYKKWYDHNTGATIKMSVKTIDIPLLVTVSAPINDFIKVGGGIGPYLSIPFGKMKVTTTPIRGGESVDNSVDAKYKYKVNFGLAIGGNVGFKVGPGTIVADLRYIFDFTPVTIKSMDGHEMPGDTGKVFYHRSFNIGAGYEYKF